MLFLVDFVVNSRGWYVENIQYSDYLIIEWDSLEEFIDLLVCCNGMF